MDGYTHLPVGCTCRACTDSRKQASNPVEERAKLGLIPWEYFYLTSASFSICLFVPGHEGRGLVILLVLIQDSSHTTLVIRQEAGPQTSEAQCRIAQKHQPSWGRAIFQWRKVMSFAKEMKPVRGQSPSAVPVSRSGWRCIGSLSPGVGLGSCFARLGGEFKHSVEVPARPVELRF